MSDKKPTVAALQRKIERLEAQSGGFGCFLVMDHHWADRLETMRSYELIARYAIPKINSLNDNRFSSEKWLKENGEKLWNCV